MLQIRNVSLILDDKPILKDISIDFSDGGLLSILGPNGSGKSSLIKCICGIYDQWTGDITLNGKNIRSFSIQERAKRISYVPQLLEVFADYTVWDFFEMSYYAQLGDLRSLSKKEIEIGNDLLCKFNLLELKDRSLLNLSGGERQRVFIASSIFQGAELLLLDEPTSFLDPKIQDDINKIIYSLRNKMNIILISHDINSTLINADRIIGLKNGKNFFDGKSKELMTNKCLDQLYEKTFKLIKHPLSEIDIVVPEIF